MQREKESGFVVNRYAIHHDGVLFDKGREALVIRAKWQMTIMQQGI
jgi:hypothetical protein